jgi:hypothetical protein
MADQREYFPWDDGLPTGPDVGILQRKWPALAVGDRIPYEEIGALLALDWRCARFRTVTAAWRQREMEAGRVLICEPGTAFVVATCAQISAATYSVLHQVGRKMKKQRTRLSTTSPANEIEKQTVEHHGRLLLAMEREAKRSRMNLLPNHSPEQPTRIGPPKAFRETEQEERRA